MPSVLAVRICWSQNGMNWNVSNVATLTFSPDLDQYGIYRLEVIAKDDSDNTAGGQSYTIDFQVSDNTSLNNWSVYPNPSNGLVRFAIELTTVPNESILTLEIFDALGRIVQNLEQEVSSGTQVITWDGRNSPHGTYWYRALLSNTNGELLLDTYGRSGVEVYKDYIVGKIVITQ